MFIRCEAALEDEDNRKPFGKGPDRNNEFEVSTFDYENCVQQCVQRRKAARMGRLDY